MNLENASNRFTLRQKAFTKKRNNISNFDGLLLKVRYNTSVADQIWGRSNK